MKQYLIALVFIITILASPFVAGVHASDLDNRFGCWCTHLHTGGVDYDWTSWDEVTGCSLSACYNGWSYSHEGTWFRRNVGLSYNPQSVCVSNFLVYTYLGPYYNQWPAQYSNPNWLGPTLLSNGDNSCWYYYQDVSSEDAIVTSTQLCVMAEQWYYSSLVPGYGVWDCYAWVLLSADGTTSTHGGTNG